MLSACGEVDPCEKINKNSACVEYNNCTILENWNVQYIELTHNCPGKPFTQTILLQDYMVVNKNGTLSLRIQESDSPLNKWKFGDCQNLILSSSSSDTTLSLTIDKMEDNKMVWSYRYTDTCDVKATIYFDRM